MGALALPSASDFVVETGRVIFDLHDEFDEQGNLLRRFDEHALAEIAKRSNARDARGAWCPLTLGHSNPGRPETEQPAAVGYARNFRVGPDPVTGRPCLLADFYIRRDQYATATSFPRTSIELWPTDLVVDPVALLRRTPKQDLPNWHYHRVGGREAIRYSREAYQTMPDPAGMAPPSATNAMPAPAPAAPAAPDPQAMADEYCRACFSHPHAKALAAHYAAGAAPPGAMPPDPAAPLGNDLPPPTPEGAPPMQFQRESAGLRAAVYARDARIAALERELREVHRRTDLTGLAAEGVQFDLDTELADAMDMTATQYARHLTRLREHYHRDPAAMGRVPVEETVPGAGPAPGQPRMVEHGALTREGMKAALAYQREHPEATYEAARDAVLKQYSRNGRN